MFNKNRNSILIISGIFIPEIGGPAIFVEALSSYLKTNGISNQIITLANIDKPFIFKNGIFKINRKLPKLIRTILLIILIYFQSLKSKKVLCCGLIFESFIANIAMKNKLVYRFVGDSIWERYIGNKDPNSFLNENINLNLKFLILIRNLILKNYNLVITPSNFLKKYLLNNLKIKESNIKIIKNFAHINTSFNNQKAKHYFFRKNNLKIVTLSRLVKWKNIDKIIKAIKNIEDIELHILGTGPEEFYLRELVLLDKIKNIKFHGFKDRNFCLSMLKYSDCFIQVSSYEGMSFSILESLYLCKPMILSGIESNIETAKSAAIYVDQNKVYEIKNAINLLKSKINRNNLIKECIKLNSNFYQKNNSLESYKKILISE